MNIMFLVSSLQFGGAERVATTLCNAWVDRGYNVTLVATYNGKSQSYFELNTKIKLHYLADNYQCLFGKNSSSLARLIKLRSLMKSDTPDVVISFLPSANVMAIFAGVKLRIPIIICERTDPEFFPQPWYWKLLCKYTYQFANLLTVQTKAVADKVPRLFNRVDTVRVVPNPLPFAVQLPVQKQIVNPPFTLLSLGRLTVGKQTSQIVGAFSEISASFPDWQLMIYGEGSERGNLEQLICELGMAERIFIKGDTKDPWQVMRDADAFVMASCFEGFPNALLEALGLGLPSVVYDCPSGPAEITEYGSIAELVTLNDIEGLKAAMFKLMSDSELRLKLSIKAAASVNARYSLENVLTIWDSILTECVDIEHRC